MISVPHHILVATFEQFREHGRGKAECVVYWIGPSHESNRVNEVIHPVHTNRRGGYQVNDAWLTAFWLELAKRGKSVRVQVHTHPHEAFHSPTDNEWALLPEAGFLSLVIPDFALGPISLQGAFLAERSTDGEWLEVSPHLHLEIYE